MFRIYRVFLIVLVYLFLSFLEVNYQFAGIENVFNNNVYILNDDFPMIEYFISFSRKAYNNSGRIYGIDFRHSGGFPIGFVYNAYGFLQGLGVLFKGVDERILVRVLYSLSILAALFLSFGTFRLLGFSFWISFFGGILFFFIFRSSFFGSFLFFGNFLSFLAPFLGFFLFSLYKRMLYNNRKVYWISFAFLFPLFFWIHKTVLYYAGFLIFLYSLLYWRRVGRNFVKIFFAMFPFIVFSIYIVYIMLPFIKEMYGYLPEKTGYGFSFIYQNYHFLWALDKSFFKRDVVNFTMFFRVLLSFAFILGVYRFRFVFKKINFFFLVGISGILVPLVLGYVDRIATIQPLRFLGLFYFASFFIFLIFFSSFRLRYVKAMFLVISVLFYFLYGGYRLSLKDRIYDRPYSKNFSSAFSYFSSLKKRQRILFEVPNLFDPMFYFIFAGSHFYMRLVDLLEHEFLGLMVKIPYKRYSLGLLSGRFLYRNVLEFPLEKFWRIIRFYRINRFFVYSFDAKIAVGELVKKGLARVDIKDKYYEVGTFIFDDDRKLKFSSYPNKLIVYSDKKLKRIFIPYNYLDGLRILNKGCRVRGLDPFDIDVYSIRIICNKKYNKFVILY